MPLTPDENKMRQFALLQVYGNAGKPLSVSAAAKEVGVHYNTANRWMKSDIVQNTIREALQHSRLKVQSLAAQHIEDAVHTLYDATTNPLATPTMVNAAKALLQYAVGTQDASESAGTTINVQVNTELNPNAIEEQRARYAKPAIIEAPAYTLLEDE